MTPTQSAIETAQPRSRLYLCALVLLWLVIYVPGLFAPALFDDADSVHAEAAREILLRHDWVTLHADGIRYLEKAPLLYWTIAASFRVFGVQEWSARLPLALGVLATMLAVFALGRRAAGEKAGFYSALTLATSLGIYIFTRILIPDLLVVLWLTLSCYFFFRILEQQKPSRGACWGLAAAAALSVLTKGLIGLVFPAAIVFLYLLLTRDLRRLLRMRLLSSAAVFLLIAAPWHILAGIRNPAAGEARGFFWFYFVNEHFLRYLNQRVPRDYDTVPLLAFWALALVWLAPWCAFLPPSLARAPHRLRDFVHALDRQQRAGLLLAIWVAVILVFFSFSTRQEYYTIPALPALALLVGGWLAQESEGSPESPRLRRAGRMSALCLFMVGIIVFVATMGLLMLSRRPPAGTELADLLKRNPEQYALSLGHVFDLTPQALGWFRGELAIVGLGFLIGTGLAWHTRRRNLPGVSNAALALMMVAILFAVWLALQKFAPILGSKELAVAIQRVYRPGDVIVINGEYESGSTLNFYTGIPVRILHERSANLWYGSFFPDAPQVFETDASIARLWDGSTRVFLWTDVRDVPQLAAKPAFELAHSGGKYILTNRRD